MISAVHGRGFFEKTVSPANIDRILRTAVTAARAGSAGIKRFEGFRGIIYKILSDFPAAGNKASLSALIAGIKRLSPDDITELRNALILSSAKMEKSERQFWLRSEELEKLFFADITFDKAIEVTSRFTRTLGLPIADSAGIGAFLLDMVAGNPSSKVGKLIEELAHLGRVTLSAGEKGQLAWHMASWNPNGIPQNVFFAMDEGNYASKDVVQFLAGMKTAGASSDFILDGANWIATWDSRFGDSFSTEIVGFMVADKTITRPEALAWIGKSATYSNQIFRQALLAKLPTA